MKLNMSESHELGKVGEDIACKYLTKKDYKIIAKNFRCKIGEIDIIAKYKDEIMFIEVKTRKKLSYGLPAEAVNEQKRKHILKTSRYYLYINKLQNKKVRFDIIEVYKKDKFYINHIKNIDII